MDVVPGQAELVEVAAHGLGGDPCLTQGPNRRPLGALGELLAVGSEDQPVVDELRRRRAQGLEQPPVEVLVRPVIVAADDVGDPEVHVVHDAGQVVGRRAVLADERDPVEALAERGRGLEVALAPLALAHRAIVPRDPKPLEVPKQFLLTAGDVARRVGVVDPQQQPVAEGAVGNCAERVTHVQRPGRAWSETHPLHRVAPTNAARSSSASSSREVSPQAPTTSSFPDLRSRRGSTRPTTRSPARSGST